MLESKDKEQLLAIAQALGIKTTSRAAKATLIDKILETTGGGSPSAAGTPPSTNGRAKAAKEATPASAPEATIETDGAAATTVAAEPGETAPSAAPVEAEVVLGPDGEPLADWEIALIKSGEVAVLTARIRAPS